MTETHPSTALDASTIVAQSLSTVGYSMFSLCQGGTLNDVESFSLVIQRGGTFESSPPSVGAVGLDNVDYVDDESVTFGEADVDANLAAVTPVVAADEAHVAPFVPPVLTSENVGASSALMAFGPDGRPLGVEPVTDSAAAPASSGPAAVPAGPVPALPDYHNNSGQSLAMLQDINFIEE